MRKPLTAVLGAMAASMAMASVLGAPAHADVRASGNGSVLSGNQVIAPVTVTVPVHDNAVTVGGLAKTG